MSAKSLNSNNYILSATTSSTQVTLTDQDINITDIMVTNIGSSPAMIVSGNSSIAAVFASSASVPVPGVPVAAGAVMSFRKNTVDKYIAGITSSGTATLILTVGAGE